VSGRDHPVASEPERAEKPFDVTIGTYRELPADVVAIQGDPSAGALRTRWEHNPGQDLVARHEIGTH
jgi:hypothetical protein